MADINRVPFARHLRGSATTWIRHTRRGVTAHEGREQSFWFRPLSAVLSEVPVDDRELPMLFHARTLDFQDVTVQATVTYRVARPELAVLTAYAKLELSEEIVASRAPEDPFFEQTLVRYFPQALARFEPEMKRHRLRREIIATVMANEVVNMCGPTFPDRLRGSAECDTTALIIAFEAARRVFRLDEAWDAV